MSNCNASRSPKGLSPAAQGPPPGLGEQQPGRRGGAAVLTTPTPQSTAQVTGPAVGT